ncbi:MAG: ferric iron uptake transcriptional regulator [Acidiferrobacterales bacterium]|nr:ferric iron uptake transcriptional regulator [Acidiferrobacterales bacterium]
MPKSNELKEAGLKTTLPRLRILAILEEGKQRHFSAEDVYKALLDAGEEIAFATVYRVLTQFENAGLVLRHNFEGGRSVFELDRGKHHDHMVCVKCNKVVEFYDDEIEKRQTKIAKEHNFDLQDHSLYLYGLCSDCQ